jgi:hypothetical protein
MSANRRALKNQSAPLPSKWHFMQGVIVSGADAFKYSYPA